MAFITSLLNILVSLVSIFLICLVLIQRGKGGGLAGAFGGSGGSSAFGTKAGDVFTRITIVTAVIWFFLAMILVIVSNQKSQQFGDTPGFSSTTSPTGAGKSTKGTGAGSTNPVAPLPGLPLPSELVPPPVGGAIPTTTPKDIPPPLPAAPSGPAAPSPGLPKNP